ncbi:MAG: hypothetical protein AMXMBFR33_57630 [Candidatus Xenobia bacterium]
MAEEEKEDKSSEHWEILFGVVLAIFAAVLAICDLGAGKYGDDEILAANEKAGAYLWYQSKGIKQTLVEGQANFMTTMIETGSVDKSKVASVEAEVAKLRTKVERYEKEKTEILEGSEKVGKENWVQEVDGKLGQVPGAKEFDRVARELGKVGDVFDQGTLYLQMCLVMGAIGIISRQEGMKRVFFAFLLVLGLLGSYYTWIAYQQAGKI